MHPAGWGLEVEDRFGGLHCWSQHTSPTVQVPAEGSAMVLDPVLFSSPVSLATWMGQFKMPGTFAARHSAAPPIPAGMRHYLQRILQMGPSAFEKLPLDLRSSLWADPQIRQQLLAASIPPLAGEEAAEVPPPRLVVLHAGLTDPYHAVCASHSQQGNDGLVIHTRFRQGAFADVPWATVAHADFLRLYPSVGPADLARLYLAGLRK
jgi:hypothetical protein